MTFCPILIHACKICIFVTLTSLKAQFSFLLLFITRKVPLAPNVTEQFQFLGLTNRCTLWVKLNYFQYFYKTS